MSVLTMGVSRQYSETSPPVDETVFERANPLIVDILKRVAMGG